MEAEEDIKMEEKRNIQISQVNPTTYEFQEYMKEDTALISSSRLDTAFSSSTDYIEYYAYDENNNQIYPASSEVKAVPLSSYKVIQGDTCLYPAKDLMEIVEVDFGTFYSTYNFYRKRLSSDINVNYYIDEISSDRTEIRIKSNAVPEDLIISSSLEFIEYRELSEYFVDFYLNFGSDQQVIANNIQLDTELEIPSVLIKLYEPLPPQFQVKSELWVVEEISAPQAYKVFLPYPEFTPDDTQVIQGPNYSIKVVGQTGEASQDFNYNTLIGTDITSSFNQLDNILKRKEVDISVDYTDYNNFVHFSSAKTRLENFYYKVGLIQKYQAEIEATPTNSSTTSGSNASLTTLITDIIENFDGFEYFMYFNSGSAKSYPKSNTAPPFELFATGSNEVLTWLGSADPSNAFYGGQALSASNYDEENKDYLFNAIPEYLKSDPSNAQYELFVDMVAQQYDNTWVYTKNLTTRFDADNRLDFGISKDLVADAIKDFGIKLYNNNFNTNDLYTAFLGLTPSGSTFPFPDMTGSIGGVVNTPSGFEYVDTEISASNDIVPLDNVNKQLYKRIYHNVPNLLKRKGTLGGLRALITAYGIPNTILRISEFGGRDREFTKDWDLEQNVFNYALHLEGTKNPTGITSSFQLNNEFTSSDDAPKSLQFRIKTPGIPTSSFYQNVWVGDTTRAYIILDYTGSGMGSGSYSGSVPSQSNAYGTLKFYPEGSIGLAAGRSASVTLPFFNGDWWSVQASFDYDNSLSASLYAANRIGEEIGFSASDSTVVVDDQYWKDTSISQFPSRSVMVLDSVDYQPLTGALQEVRYWDVVLSESLFYDYVVNPYSTQGNTINATPNDLAFRADLGTELDTGSRKSIHPKVTGSWSITSSFNDGTSTFELTGSFIQNTESIFYNQTPGGIKNRVSDRIRIVSSSLPTGSTLSPYRSIQQEVFPSGSNPSINYLEVAFSPQNQINDDIIAQIGDFNLGDYIGDPRQISQSGTSYPALDALRDAYFTKYINSYDLNDFIRLIKFFDNSLFKMIDDFTPARTTLSSGVVIKQNLLERNRQAPPSMSFIEEIYTGSVKSFARDYNVHFAKERPGNALINAQVITASSVTNTSNWPDGAPTGSQSFITASGGSGTGATFRPIVDTNQVISVVVEQTGSGYASGDVLTFTSQSISSSLVSSVTPIAVLTEVDNNIEVTLGVNNIAPTLSPNSDFPTQNFASGSSIYRFSGGTGGVFEPFNNLFNAPISYSNQEFDYLYNFFTGSTTFDPVLSASSGTFGFNSTDGATATEIYLKSVSSGNAPTSSYSPNVYTLLNVLSSSMVNFPGQPTGFINFKQLTTYRDPAFNPDKNDYNTQLANYTIDSVIDYLPPPLISGSQLTVTTEPNTSLVSQLAITQAIISTTTTSGKGSGIQLNVTTIPTLNVFVQVTVDDIGEKYEPGDTVTVTSTELQAAGFPAQFNGDLVLTLEATNFADDNPQNGTWKLGVTNTAASFSTGTYAASTFTESFNGGYTSSFFVELITNEGAYSGLTAAQVSASQFSKQYPGVVQVLSESLDTTLGVGFPVGSSYTQSTSNVYGQGIYDYPRIDQREFYTGEFPGAIDVGTNEVCKAFFGQESRIDYFFVVQWFNDNTITEQDFLSDDIGFQPQAGNVWFWGDTVSIPRSGSVGSTARCVINPDLAVVTTDVQGTFDIETFTYTGPAAEGSGGVIRVISEGDGGGTPEIIHAQFIYHAISPDQNRLLESITQNTTGGTNQRYTGITQTSTSGQGSGAEFQIDLIGGSITGIRATATGSLYETGDTITFAAGTFGGSSTETIITLRSEDLQPGLQKKYNAAPTDADRKITITQATLIAAGFTNASADLELFLPNSALDPIPGNKVKYIKMSDEDYNGQGVLAFIEDSDFVTFTLTGAANYLNQQLETGFQTFFISNHSVQTPTAQFPNQPVDESALLYIFMEPSSVAVSSFDTLAYDFSFSASGQLVYYATSSGEDPDVVHETGFTESVAQGYFPRSASQNEFPGSGFTTESFFRGWASAYWLDIDLTGGLVEVGTGSGFLSDPLGNFNTGSREQNNDALDPYQVSTYPWYMNATQGHSAAGQTFQILSASGLVGDHGATDLQLYTGSITASSELIYPGFTIFTPPTATEDNGAVVTINQINVPNILSRTCGPNLGSIPNTPGSTVYSISVSCTQQTGNWSIVVSYLDGSGWINVTSGTTYTGDDTITFTVSNGDNGGTLLNREANIDIINTTNPSQPTLSCLVSQDYRDNSFGGGGFSPN